MTEILPWIQIILSVLLTMSIVIQHSESGIEGALGGGSFEGGHHRTRRGFDSFIYRATIVLGILLAVSALASLILN